MIRLLCRVVIPAGRSDDTAPLCVEHSSFPAIQSDARLPIRSQDCVRGAVTCICAFFICSVEAEKFLIEHVDLEVACMAMDVDIFHFPPKYS